MTIIIEKYMVFLVLFISTYIISAIICYGLALPFMEILVKKSYESRKEPFKGRGIEKASFYLSLLGPVGLYAFVCSTKTMYCGFRYRRKYLRYIKDDKEIVKGDS